MNIVLQLVALFGLVSVVYGVDALSRAAAFMVAGGLVFIWAEIALVQLAKRRIRGEQEDDG